MLKSFMFPNILSFFKNHFSFNPWIYFLVFLISNTILSFVSLTPSAKLIVIVLGLLMPWAAGLISVSQQSTVNPNPLDSRNIPLWLWIIAFSLFSGMLFYHLTTLPFWPIP